MTAVDLLVTATALSTGDKGLLAIDKSNPR
jgi:hypothetical protein